MGWIFECSTHTHRAEFRGHETTHNTEQGAWSITNPNVAVFFFFPGSWPTEIWQITICNTSWSHNEKENFPIGLSQGSENTRLLEVFMTSIHFFGWNINILRCWNPRNRCWEGLYKGLPTPPYKVFGGFGESGWLSWYCSSWAKLGTWNVHQFPFMWKSITLPKTNIAPENRPSQKETSIPTIHVQVRTVSFREGILDKKIQQIGPPKKKKTNSWNAGKWTETTITIYVYIYT